MSLYFASPEGLPLSFTASGNQHISVTITGSVATFLDNGFFGVEDVVFTATDSKGRRKESHPVALLAKSETQNNPPILRPITQIYLDGSQNPTDVINDTININEGQSFRLIAEADDIDNSRQELIFTFGAPLDEFGCWQTNYNDSGIYIAKITVTDPSGVSDSRNVTINVADINRAPEFKTIDITPSGPYYEGELIKIVPYAIDPDGDCVTYTFDTPFDENGEWHTTYTDTGGASAKTFYIDVTASDGSLSSRETVSVTLNDVNMEPEISIQLSSYNVKVKDEFTIYIHAVDPDGYNLRDSVVIKIDGIAVGEPVEEYLPTYYKLTTSRETAGLYTVEVSVSDGVALSTASTKINIIDPLLELSEIHPIAGDFNGDGVADIGIFKALTGEWDIAVSDHGRFTFFTERKSDMGSSGWVPFTGDFNGDGFTDIGARNYGNEDGNIKWALYDPGSQSFGDVTLINDFFSGSDWLHTTGDFNGDGCIDIGRYYPRGGNWQVALSDNGSFSSFPHMDSGEPFANFSFGGSGWSPVVGDFNADGLTDICIFLSSEGIWRVAFSNGSTFITDGSDWLRGFGVGKTPITGDFNSDGMTDVGYFDRDTGEWYVAYSTGSGFDIQDTLFLSGFGVGSENSAAPGDFSMVMACSIPHYLITVVSVLKNGR
jgi:hypothetical protein